MFDANHRILGSCCHVWSKFWPKTDGFRACSGCEWPRHQCWYFGPHSPSEGFCGERHNSEKQNTNSTWAPYVLENSGFYFCRRQQDRCWSTIDFQNSAQYIHDAIIKFLLLHAAVCQWRYHPGPPTLQRLACGHWMHSKPIQREANSYLRGRGEINDFLPIKIIYIKGKWLKPNHSFAMSCRNIKNCPILLSRFANTTGPCYGAHLQGD